MKVLVLSFYYQPDLCAGSFRTTALIEALSNKSGVEIELITTAPNRYASFSIEALEYEKSANVEVHRIALPTHNSGMLDQAKAFYAYYRRAMDIIDTKQYDMVYATSSRLFTAFLGARIANKKGLPLYLDIRDIFVDTIKDILSPKLTWVAKPVFSLVEKYAFSRAKKINLVSKGFQGYFEARYPSKDFSWFTNGIDQAFLNQPLLESTYSRGDAKINILYAGNIGEGQGLHTILPALAAVLSNKIHITVIGDGGRKALLKGECRGLDNITFKAPITRNQLIVEYKQADVLFLHLSDYPAFKKVLPSKIFEYAAMGKPVWAGVSGFPAEFLTQEVSNSAVFYPGNVTEAVSAFSKLAIKSSNRDMFKTKFSRKNIMEKMAVEIAGFTKND
ncbi:MAG: glycosyltransferase family 4 protein [Colwellia sp.]